MGGKKNKHHSVSTFLCIYVWTQLDKGSYLQALPELKFLACQQQSCERRAIMQTVGLWKKKKSRSCWTGTSGSWTEYKTCINTCSEEVKVMLQSQFESVGGCGHQKGDLSSDKKNMTCTWLDLGQHFLGYIWKGFNIQRKIWMELSKLICVRLLIDSLEMLSSVSVSQNHRGVWKANDTYCRLFNLYPVEKPLIFWIVPCISS